jgi:ADP-ribosylglycohydrolase
MLAVAYVLDDVSAVIQAGLAQIPARCRLAEGIQRILDLHAKGTAEEAVFADIASRWDENVGHDWCHTISNAEIVAASLLWGGKDFGRTICLSVMPGFDTDCNGATAGSVLGLILGAKALPGQWIEPLNDTLLTGLAGYHKVSLSDMAAKTAKIALG